MRTMLAAVAVTVLALATAISGGARVTAAGRGSNDWCAKRGDTPVHLRASDGARIYGLEVGSGKTGVVLAHQVGSDHCEMMDFARELAKRGYRALAIDFRGSGDSQFGSGDPPRLDRDVAAAVVRLRADGATKVKLVGASMGGTAVLVAASLVTPAVAGVVSLSGPTYFGRLDALTAVKRSHVPVRFLVGKADIGFADNAQQLMRAAAARDKAIVRYPGGFHGSSLLDRPAAKAYVLAFLAR